MKREKILPAIMAVLLTLFCASIGLLCNAQSPGSPKWFFKGATSADQTGYVPKVNSSLYAINGAGNFALLAQSTFANAAHTHPWLDLTTVPAALSDVAMGTWTGATSITTLGTITTGTVPVANVSGFNAAGDARWSLLGHVHAYSSLTGIPASFTPSAHTHLSADVTDASTGGNEGADSGLLAKYNTQGQLHGSVVNSTTPAIYGTSSGTGYAGYFNAASAISTLRAQNGGVGPALYGTAYDGHGVDAESTNGVALHVHAVDVANANVALAEFAEGLSETVRLTVGNDGGLTWTGTGAQTTATNLPAFGSATKGVVPASGGGTSNFLRADGTWATTGGGSGTVTSVAISGSDGIDIDSGSPITTSGTIALGVNANTLKTHLSLNNVENTALSTWTGTGFIDKIGTLTSGTVPVANVSGLGSLATQNGTFSGTHSGTSSGTNTGDQNLAPYQTIAALPADVRAVTLTGLSTSTAQPIVAGDQLLAALGYLQGQLNTTTRVVTTADFTSASTSLVNVTPASGPNLALAVAANSIYDFELVAEWSSSNSSGTCNWTFTAPSAATHTGYRHATRADNTVTNGGVGPTDDTSFGLASSVVTANARCSLIISGKLITGANAGTFQFRLASGNAAWTAKIFSGSSLRLIKVQ